MAQVLPPAPIDSPFGSYNWADWYEKVRRLINAVTVIAWSQINDFTGSNLNQLATRLHESLQGLQGGAANDRFHLTTVQHTALTAGFSGTGKLVRETSPVFTTGITTGGGTFLTSSVALTNGAAGAAGTLANAPTAGNPTKWIPINDNGTTRYIPCW